MTNPTARAPSDAWTLERMLQWGTGYLKHSGSPSARLDAQLLIGHACNLDKVQLYVQFERPLATAELDTLRALFKRRAAGEPVAYILGEKEFYQRSFLVNTGVLVPRPETEHLVDAVLEYLDGHDLPNPNLVDVGTGSGCIAVTLAAQWPEATVLAIDTAADALQVAALNAEKHSVRDRVKLAQGHLLDPIQSTDSVDVVVSNPPYLDATLMGTLPRDIRDFEPIGALDGGPDGLDLIRDLVADAPRVLKAGGLLAMEVAHDEQAAAVQALLDSQSALSFQQIIPDYAGIGRVVTALKEQS